MDIEKSNILNSLYSNVNEVSQQIIKEFESLKQNQQQNLSDKSEKNQNIKLLSQLKALTLNLQQFQQEEEIVEKNCPQLLELLEKSINLEIQQKEVKCMLAAVFLQVLRISAPESPFNDDILQDLFELVYEAMGCVSSHSQLQSIGIAVLTLLSTTKCHIITLDINEEKYAFKSIQAMLRLMGQISQNNELQAEVYQQAQQVIYDTLEQIKEPTIQLFELILSFTMTPRSSSHKLYQQYSLASTTLTHFEKEFKEIVLSHVVKYFEGQIKSSQVQINSSYLKSIFVYMPSTMSQIIPHFENQIHELVEQRRFWATQQIGKVLISVSQLFNSPQYANSSHTISDRVSNSTIQSNFLLLFECLMSRISDISAEIRHLVINDLFMVVKENFLQQPPAKQVQSDKAPLSNNNTYKLQDGRFQNQISPKLEEMLDEICSRTRDSVERVRICAIAVLTQFILLVPKCIKKEYIKEIQLRMQDQKLGVRKESALKLHALFSYYQSCFIYGKLVKMCPQSHNQKYQVEEDQCRVYVEKVLKMDWEDIEYVLYMDPNILKLIYNIPGLLLAMIKYDSILYQYIIDDVIASKGLFNQTVFTQDQSRQPTKQDFLFTASQMQNEPEKQQDTNMDEDPQSPHKVDEEIKQENEKKRGKKQKKGDSKQQQHQKMSLGQFPNAKQKAWITQIQYFLQSYFIFRVLISMDSKTFNNLELALKRQGQVLQNLQRLIEAVYKLDQLKPNVDLPKMLKKELNQEIGQLNEEQQKEVVGIQIDVQKIGLLLASTLSLNQDIVDQNPIQANEKNSASAKSIPLTHAINSIQEIRDISMMQFLSCVAEGRDVVAAQSLIVEFMKIYERKDALSSPNSQTLRQSLRSVLNSAALSIIGQYQFSGLLMVFDAITQVYRSADSQTQMDLDFAGGLFEGTYNTTQRAQNDNSQTRTMLSQLATGDVTDNQKTQLYCFLSDQEFQASFARMLHEDQITPFLKANLYPSVSFQLLSVARQNPVLARLQNEYVEKCLGSENHPLIVLVLKLIQSGIQTGIRSPPFQKKFKEKERNKSGSDPESNFPKQVQTPFIKAAQLNSLDWQTSFDTASFYQLIKHHNYRIAYAATKTLGLFYYCQKSRWNFNQNNQEFKSDFVKLEKLLRSVYDNTEASLQKPLLSENFLEVTASIHVMSCLGSLIPQIFSDYARAFAVFIEDNYMFCQATLSQSEYEQAIDSKSLIVCKDANFSFQAALWDDVDPVSVLKSTCHKAIAKSCIPINLQNKFPATQTSQYESESLAQLAKNVFDSCSSTLQQEVVYEETDKLAHIQQGLTRQQVAEAMLILLQKYDRIFTPKHYTSLAVTIQDPITEVRAAFQLKVQKYVRKLQLSSKLAAFYSFSGMDPNNNHRENSIENLKQFVQMRRFHVQKQIIPHYQKGQQLPLHLLPEFTLYYVIYILSHHPDFLGPESDAEQLKPFQIMLQYAMLPFLVLESPYRSNTKKHAKLEVPFEEVGSSVSQDIDLYNLDFVNFVVSTILNSFTILKDSQSQVKNGEDQTENIQFISLLAKKEWEQLLAFVSDKQGITIDKKAKFDIQVTAPKEYKQVDHTERHNSQKQIQALTNSLKKLPKFELSQILLCQIKERPSIDPNNSIKGENTKSPNRESQKQNEIDGIQKGGASPQQQQLTHKPNQAKSLVKKIKNENVKEYKDRKRAREDHRDGQQSKRPLRNSKDQKKNYRDDSSDSNISTQSQEGGQGNLFTYSQQQAQNNEDFTDIKAPKKGGKLKPSNNSFLKGNTNLSKQQDTQNDDIGKGEEQNQSLKFNQFQNELQHEDTLLEHKNLGSSTSKHAQNSQIQETQDSQQGSQDPLAAQNYTSYDKQTKNLLKRNNTDLTKQKLQKDTEQAQESAKKAPKPKAEKVKKQNLDRQLKDQHLNQQRKEAQLQNNNVDNKQKDRSKRSNQKHGNGYDMSSSDEENGSVQKQNPSPLMLGRSLKAKKQQQIHDIEKSRDEKQGQFQVKKQRGKKHKAN